MATRGSNRIEFCPGCPEQSNFMGSITENAIIPERRGDSASTLDLKFIDEDGIETATHRFGTLSTVEIEKLGANKSDTNSITEAGNQVMDALVPAVVERIERCDGPRGSRCPAFNSTVMGMMFEKYVEENQVNQ